MEIRQLKYFVKVAETGSFSETSRQMCISQSAVSQQIKALEDELGVQLFIRQSRNVPLTENGKELLPLARQVLSFLSDCNERLNALKGLLCGEINIGLTFSMEPFLRETIIDFMKQYPRVLINIYYKGIKELMEMLRESEIDVLFSMKPPVYYDYVDSQPVTEYHLAAIMRSNHVLANRSILTFKDLERHWLVLPEKGIRERNAIETFLQTDTGKLNVRSYINDQNALLNIIEATNCISILAEQSIKDRPLLKGIRISELYTPIRVYAHFNKDVIHKNSVDVFLKMLKESSTLYVIRNRI